MQMQEIYKENSTPSLSVKAIIAEGRKYLEKPKKLGARENKPYWVAVKGVIRWELRQHFRNSTGKRLTRVLKTVKRKPRGI